MAYLYGLQEGVADELGSFMSIALEVCHRCFEEIGTLMISVHASLSIT